MSGRERPCSFQSEFSKKLQGEGLTLILRDRESQPGTQDLWRNPRATPQLKTLCTIPYQFTAPTRRDDGSAQRRVLLQKRSFEAKNPLSPYTRNGPGRAGMKKLSAGSCQNKLPVKEQRCDGQRTITQKQGKGKRRFGILRVVQLQVMFPRPYSCFSSLASLQTVTIFLTACFPKLDPVLQREPYQHSSGKITSSSCR